MEVLSLTFAAGTLLASAVLDGLASAQERQNSVRRWSADIVPHCCRFQP
jgi:hypothetical protein